MKYFYTYEQLCYWNGVTVERDWSNCDPDSTIVVWRGEILSYKGDLEDFERDFFPWSVKLIGIGRLGFTFLYVRTDEYPLMWVWRGIQHYSGWSLWELNQLLLWRLSKIGLVERVPGQYLSWKNFRVWS